VELKSKKRIIGNMEYIDSIYEVKNISIHSEDRNIRYWKNANHFSIELPEPVKNIKALQLKDIELPILYSFSKSYNNCSFDISCDFPNSGSNKTITITDGNYTGEQMAYELQNQLNYTFREIDSVYDSNDVSIQFHVFYHEVMDKCIIIHPTQKFELFKTNETNDYDLLYYLGFEYNSSRDKTNGLSSIEYDLSLNNINNIHFMYSSIKSTSPNIDEHPLQYLDSIINTSVDSSLNVIIPHTKQRIYGEKMVYIEVDGFNSINELEPNKSKSFKVNSAISYVKNKYKSDIITHDNERIVSDNQTIFKVTKERIQKLTFKFRFHNGKLVDFQNSPFSFMLSFTTIRE
jgi:hypothetical protein